jgi:hypothetical protein
VVMEFEIKETGFYLTRNGTLHEVVAILKGFEFPVIAINADGNVDSWRCNGSYIISGVDYHDIVSYLPTVKSWDDPIPPPEPPELPEHLQHTDPPQYRTIQHGEISHDGWIVQRKPLASEVYTEWLSVGKDCGRAWTGWTKGDVKPCYAVAKLRTVEVPSDG